MSQVRPNLRAPPGTNTRGRPTIVLRHTYRSKAKHSEAFILDIAEWVQPVGEINPHYYFVTSGAADWKCQKMIADLEAAGHTEQAENAKKLLAYLLDRKGDFVHLETERGDNHELWVIPKNPREGLNAGKVREALAAGESKVSVARRLGVNPSTIRYALQNEIKKRQKSNPDQPEED